LARVLALENGEQLVTRRRRSQRLSPPSAADFHPATTSPPDGASGNRAGLEHISLCEAGKALRQRRRPAVRWDCKAVAGGYAIASQVLSATPRDSTATLSEIRIINDLREERRPEEPEPSIKTRRARSFIVFPLIEDAQRGRPLGAIWAAYLFVLNKKPRPGRMVGAPKALIEINDARAAPQTI
jgi:hypothetical protein